METTPCDNHEARISLLEGKTKEHDGMLMEIVQRVTAVEKSAKSAHIRTNEEREARIKFEDTVNGQLSEMRSQLNVLHGELATNTRATNDLVGKMATAEENSKQARIREAQRDKKIGRLLKLCGGCFAVVIVLIVIMLWKNWITSSELVDAAKIAITATTVL